MGWTVTASAYAQWAAASAGRRLGTHQGKDPTVEQLQARAPQLAGHGGVVGHGLHPLAVAPGSNLGGVRQIVLDGVTLHQTA